MILLVGVSRVCVGAHYLSDMLALPPRVWLGRRCLLLWWTPCAVTGVFEKSETERDMKPPEAHSKPGSEEIDQAKIRHDGRQSLSTRLARQYCKVPMSATTQEKPFEPWPESNPSREA